MSTLADFLNKERSVRVGDFEVSLHAPDTMLASRLGVRFAPLMNIGDEPTDEERLAQATALHDFHVELVQACMIAPLEYRLTSQLIHEAGGLDSELVQECMNLAGMNVPKEVGEAAVPLSEQE